MILDIAQGIAALGGSGGANKQFPKDFFPKLENYMNGVPDSYGGDWTNKLKKWKNRTGQTVTYGMNKGATPNSEIQTKVANQTKSAAAKSSSSAVIDKAGSFFKTTAGIIVMVVVIGGTILYFIFKPKKRRRRR